MQLRKRRLNIGIALFTGFIAVASVTSFAEGEKQIAPATASDSSSDFWGRFLIGAVGGFIASFLGRFIIIYVNTKSLKAIKDKFEGNHGNLRLYNSSPFSIQSAYAYITIKFDPRSGDIIDPEQINASIQNRVKNMNHSINAFIHPDHEARLVEDRLCWAVTVPEWNPPNVDIRAREYQKLCVVKKGEEIINNKTVTFFEIPSEKGFASDDAA